MWAEYSPENNDLQNFLRSALQAELDKRWMSRRMRSLRIAGFPTKKRFEYLIWMICRKMVEKLSLH